MYLSFNNQKQISHFFITFNDWIILLNKSFYPFHHQHLKILFWQFFEYLMGSKYIVRSNFFLYHTLIFYLLDVRLDGDSKLKVELLIHSSLFVIFLEEFQLIVQQRNSDFICLNTLHYFRKTAFDFRIKISLS
jgi:hypothetical protein